jgi:hypothetical protein
MFVIENIIRKFIYKSNLSVLRERVFILNDRKVLSLDEVFVLFRLIREQEEERMYST